MADWKHRKLENTRKIRLLKLQAGTSGSPLHCTCVHVSLEDVPAYNALSYTWGSQPIDCSITIEGRPFKISRNVFDFMTEIRSEHKDCLLWVDAICINQSDAEEKNQQVRQMSDIYVKASAVLVWLGLADTDSAIAFDLLSRLQDFFETTGDDDFVTAETLYNGLGIDSRDRAWKALANLLDRPWFRRTWIVQEVVLGSKVAILCGSSFMMFDAMYPMLQRLRYYNLHDLIRTDNDTTPGDHFHKLYNLKARYMSGGSIPLSVTLWLMQNFEATDPRDKIYGLLGLVTDAEDYKTTIDYAKSIKQVYMECTRYLLDMEQQFTILTRAGIGDGGHLQNVPSWVPDYSAPNVPFSLLIDFAVPAAYAAGGTYRETCPSFMIDGDELKVKGYITGSVSTVGEVYTDEPLIWQDQAIDLAAPIANIWYARGALDDFFRAFWTTLVAGDTSRVVDADRGSNISYGEYYDAYQTCRNGAQAMKRASSEGVEFPLTLDVPPIVTARAEFFAIAMRNASRWRRFCTTNTSDIGLVPPLSQVHDVICIVPGVCLPYVLRPIPDDDSFSTEATAYAFVGECYIHGLMSGEGMSGELQEIVLR